MEFVHLVWAETVQVAANTMASAAETMRRAANEMVYALQQHREMMREFVDTMNREEDWRKGEGRP